MSPIWSVWLLAVGVSFVVLEGHAYFTGSQMLTHWARLATVKWPWTPYLMGAAVIVLAAHFWWEEYAKK